MVIGNGQVSIVISEKMNMYRIETNKKDSKAELYNYAYNLLKDEVILSAEVTEPKKNDPDGYFEVSKEDKVIGVAFVLDEMNPLVFRIQFEKEYGISSHGVDEDLLNIVSSAITKVFSEYKVTYL